MKTVISLRQIVDRFGWLALFIAAIGLYYLNLTFDQGATVFGNLFVPDGVTILNGAACDSFAECFEIFDAVYINQATGWLTYALYGYLHLLSPYLIFIANVVLVTHAYVKINAFCDTKGFKVFLIAPYFLVALSLPSKDILCLYLVSYFVPVIWNRQWVIAILISFIIYLARDGTGLICLFFILFIFMKDKLKIEEGKYLVAFFLVSIVASGALVAQFDVGARYTELAIDTKNIESIPAPIRPLFNLAVSVFHQWLRPNFLVESIYSSGTILISILGLAYWISGISVVIGIFLSIKSVYVGAAEQAKDKKTFISVMLLFFALVLAFNPVIQPRYLYSVIPFAIIFFSGKKPMLLYYSVLALIAIVQLPIQLFLGAGGYNGFNYEDFRFPF